MAGLSDNGTVEAAECPLCLKPTELCVCDGVEPMDNRVELLVLQHPQEQDKTLGTARLAVLHFNKASLKIGLSWSSLSKALGREVNPQSWAVLYLGSSAAPQAVSPGREVVVLDAKGNPVADQEAASSRIEGVIVLDGTWSQAKALWWRNPWVLKCRRVVLNPKRPSRYGRIRKEPRPDSLSTLEAAALLLSRLEDRPEIAERLETSFERMLERYRAAKAKGTVGAPPSKAKPGTGGRWRGRGRRQRQ